MTLLGLSTKSYWAANLYDLRRVLGDLKVFREFKKAGAETPEEIYQFARKMGIEQIYEEIKWVADLIRERRPRNLIEIGTQRGANAFFLSRFMPPGSKLVTIDVAPRIGYSMSVHNHQLKMARKAETGHRMRKSWKPFRSGFTVFRHRLIKYFSNSDCQVIPFYTYLNPAEDAHFISVNVLGGQEFDMIFYDADKTEHGTKSILNAYLGFLRREGLLVIQDINYAPDSGNNGMVRYWHNLNETRFKKLGERIHNQPGGGCGIGVAAKI